MTTLVQTRQPLLVLDMSNQPERRKSKRLACTFPAPPLVAVAVAATTATQHQFPCATMTQFERGGDTDARIVAAASVYDEQDGDFLFTRGSKRVKTGTESESPAAPAVASTAPRTAPKSVGRPSKTTSKRRPSPSSPPPPPPVAQPKVAPAATRRTSKRKSSLAAAPPATDAVAPKPRGRPKKSDPAERIPEVEEEPERAPPPPKSTRGNGKRAARERVEADESMELVAATPDVEGRSAEGERSYESQQIALPFSDTPIINRNKELRKKGGASGSRRSSLGMRGRRASSLIDNGHNALPHREVDPAEFYKHIEAEGLSEPRRMKQLLIWCGERSLSEKPPHGSHGSSAVLGGEWKLAVSESWLEC